MTRRGNKSRSPPRPCSDSEPEPLVDRLVHQLQVAQARIAELEELLGSSAAQKRANDDDLFGPAALTPRQREIARLFTIHANDKRIAAHLGIAVQTVRNHLAAIQHKLRVASREELVLRLCSRTGSEAK